MQPAGIFSAFACANSRARCIAPIDVQQQLAMFTQQADDGRKHRHQSTPTKAVLKGFTIFQQVRIKTQAGIDEEDLVVDAANLNCGRRPAEQQFKSRVCILRDRMATSKIIERALWQYTESTAAADCLLG